MAVLAYKAVTHDPVITQLHYIRQVGGDNYDVITILPCDATEQRKDFPLLL